ncbi:MAG: HD domain-containing protein [Deltaproteobacteria bacterium]|nr:HD domain-containing protein [Deltaproteobacteria bacterium]
MERPERQAPDLRVWVEDLKENDRVSGLYLVKIKRLGTTRKGDPFLSLVLADRTGEVEARVWDDAETTSRRFAEGDVVAVEGRAGSYRNVVQLVLSRVDKAGSIEDPSLFLEASALDAKEMMGALRSLLGTIENPHLKRLVERFLSDRAFSALFRKAPAAKNFHHGYLGGLLEHTLSVCRLAAAVAELYPDLDRDLLLCGAFLHDIGKIREYSYTTHIDYTDEGRLLGHLALGTAMLDEKLACIRGFPPELAVRLKHLILSHHGELAFGSPKRPKFLEAFALHLADDLDAKMNGLRRFMDRDRNDGAWTEFNRLFERYFLKGAIGECGTDYETPAGDEEDRQSTLFGS